MGLINLIDRLDLSTASYFEVKKNYRMKTCEGTYTRFFITALAMKITMSLIQSFIKINSQRVTTNGSKWPNNDHVTK